MSTKQETFDNYDPYKFLANPKFEGLDSTSRYFEYMSAIYAEALHAGGLNVSNPQIANMIHYNKTQKRENLDPPYVGRTYVFFTRPDCAWNMPNITTRPEIEFLWHTDIGKQLMCMLTTPERLIGGSFLRGDKFNEKMTEIEIEQAKKIGEEIRKMGQQREDEEYFAKVQAATAKVIEGEYGTEAMAFYLDRWAPTIRNTRDDKNPAMDNESASLFTRKYYSWEAKGPEAFYASLLPYIVNENDKRGPRGKFITRFIPLLTNTCIEAPAGRDLALEIVETAKDFQNNYLMYATDSDEINAPTEITFSFENMQNNSVWLLFFLWISYIRHVARGRMFARYESINDRKIDYTTSFFVFVTAEDGMTLKGWARGMGCFPVNLSMQGLSHSREPSIDAWRNISIPFKVNKYRMMDPNDLKDFNYFSAAEWLRKPRIFRDGYFSLEATKDNRVFTPQMIYEDVSAEDRGISGQIPRRLLNTKGIFNINSPVDKANNTWGGYPYIIDGNKFVWVDPDSFLDNSYQEHLRETGKLYKGDSNNGLGGDGDLDLTPGAFNLKLKEDLKK